MGHLNFPIFPVWDSLTSETSSEELNCCVFGKFFLIWNFSGNFGHFWPKKSIKMSLSATFKNRSHNLSDINLFLTTHRPLWLNDDHFRQQPLSATATSGYFRQRPLSTAATLGNGHFRPLSTTTVLDNLYAILPLILKTSHPTILT